MASNGSWRYAFVPVESEHIRAPQATRLVTEDRLPQRKEAASDEFVKGFVGVNFAVLIEPMIESVLARYPVNDALIVGDKLALCFRLAGLSEPH